MACGCSNLPHSRFLSDGPLPFGKLALQSAEYREFACSRETADWLLAGAMRSLDGRPVRLQIMDECRGGFNVMVKVWDAPEVLESAREMQAEAWAA